MNKKKLILIAEYDISIRTVLSTELENKFDLKLTDNCAQLWNWVSDGLGDLIILDVMMPDENGLELIPKIKEIRPDVKIIVISAQNTILTAMQAVEKGAYEYLAKPFDLIELNKVIDVAFSDDKSLKTDNSLVYTIKEQERIAQLVFIQHEQAEFEIVDSLSETERQDGGFGSSGK